MSPAMALLIWLALPDWEKIFEGTGPTGWVTSVAAASRDDWFVGGQWGVARATKAGGLERQPSGDRPVLGLFCDSPNSIYALGGDELILHFDGTKWREEHVGPRPKPNRHGRGADLVHYAFRERSDAPLVAAGPWLVLVRQPDGSWVLPPEAERARLLHLADMGPEIETPPRCAFASWTWLGTNRGAFYCHDRRFFTFDAGKVAAKGRLPAACDGGLRVMTSGRGELYATCSGPTLWRTEGDKWLRIAGPKGLNRFSSVFVTDDCTFLTSGRTVWRRCER